jgi:hypothetical protein
MKGTNENNANNPGRAQHALDLEGLNKRHLQRSDKFYRMYSGAASTLKGFHAGFIYLDILIDDRLKIPLDTIARNIAKSWRSEKELSGAVAYCVSIYRSARWSGFHLAGADIASKQKIEEAVKRMKEPANEPDIFIKVIEEPYGLAEKMVM